MGDRLAKWVITELRYEDCLEMWIAEAARPKGVWYSQECGMTGQTITDRQIEEDEEGQGGKLKHTEMTSWRGCIMNP